MPIQFEFVGVLFADIEGFSRLEDEEIQAFTDDVLSALATDVVDRHREYLIDLNTWGDAIFATSKDALDLARLALELRDFFLHPPRNLERLVKNKLRIRIAIDLAQVRVAKNYILSSEGGVKGCFGRELTLAARIEPVTPANVIFMTRVFAEAIQDRDRAKLMQVVPFAKTLRLPKKAGQVEVFSLHWETEKVNVDWKDPLKELEAVAPMLVDSWFTAERHRHAEVETRLRRCQEGERVRFIAITGKSIIFDRDPGSNEEIRKVSAVARAIENGACICGIVLDRMCEEATFRSKIEENHILVEDAIRIEGIPTHQAWDALKEKVRTNLRLRKTQRGLTFNLWLFDDSAIVEPYHFGKLPDKRREPHMCKFSQFTIFRERDEEYRMLKQHFENLWNDARPVWPEFQGSEVPQC